MREYKGRKVLKQLSARLVSESGALPDCICEIVLTEDTLYALEDEFNGEYTIHYAIPCSHIERIEKYRDTESRNNGDAGALTPRRYALMAFVGLIGGLIVLPNKKSSAQNVCTEYLRVVCADGTDKKRHVYFSEVAGSVKGLSRAFNKIKNAYEL